jgi:hypothetical protein
VAIDDHEGTFVSLLHHHDGNLLADFGQRGQEPPLLFRADHLQPLVAKFELMKFYFHAFRPP